MFVPNEDDLSLQHVFFRPPFDIARLFFCRRRHVLDDIIIIIIIYNICIYIYRERERVFLIPDLDSV